jgi:alcohol dehydrogenase class IV
MISLDFGGLSPFLLEAGVANKIGGRIKSLGAKRPLIVADRKLNVAGEVVANIRENFHNVAVTGFDVDATHGAINSTFCLGRSAMSDVIVGLGDDNVMSTAKLAACALASSGGLADVIEERRFAQRLPLILIPVGAGGGTEVSSVAALVTPSGKLISFSSATLRPDLTFLDPELAASIPWHITAAMAIQAIVQAIEAYTSRHNKNAVADMFACGALSLLVSNVAAVIEAPNDLSVRGKMLLGSALAGYAIASAPGGAISALSGPLRTRFHVSQGVASAPLLCSVLELNAEKAHAQYAELAGVIEARHRTLAGFVVRIREVLVESNLFLRLRDLGVTKADLDDLAVEVMRESECLSNNPIEIDLSIARKLYELAF